MKMKNRLLTGALCGALRMGAAVLALAATVLYPVETAPREEGDLSAKS